MRIDWCIPDMLCRLRFVVNGIRSLFGLVVLLNVFMFKSNSLVNPKNLYGFSGLGRTRRGLVGLKYLYIY